LSPLRRATICAPSNAQAATIRKTRCCISSGHRGRGGHHLRFGASPRPCTRRERSAIGRPALNPRQRSPPTETTAHPGSGFWVFSPAALPPSPQPRAYSSRQARSMPRSRAAACRGDRNRERPSSEPRPRRLASDHPTVPVRPDWRLSQRHAIATDFVPLWIPTRALMPPAGSDWIHEIKHDGRLPRPPSCAPR
jgi:hypothetical protein